MLSSGDGMNEGQHNWLNSGKFLYAESVHYRKPLSGTAIIYNKYPYLGKPEKANSQY